MSRQRIWPAILTLYVLAAIIPECIATYNTAPRSFLGNPALFFYETAFYGSAALLIREVVRRRARGWTSFLLLGAAFGFVNEGIVAGTWYKVVPDGYALFGGVDWGWAVALTAFHTIYSVAIPILLVEILFPSVAGQPWLKRPGLFGFGILLTITTSLAFFTPTDRVARFLVLLAVGVLVGIACLLPAAPPRVRMPRAVPGPGKLRASGFAGTLLFFSAIILVPVLLTRVGALSSGLVEAFVILLILVVCGFLLSILRNWSGRCDWQRPQLLALLTGALLPAIILSLLLPVTWLAAQPAATLPLLALLIWLAHRTRSQPLPVWERTTLKLADNYESYAEKSYM